MTICIISEGPDPIYLSSVLFSSVTPAKVLTLQNPYTSKHQSETHYILSALRPP